MNSNLLKSAALVLVAGASMLLTACGGGGGNSAPVVYYPYETVYGDVCTSSSPTPGCTFNRNGTRVTVSQDADYNKYGYGSDDLWYVNFYADGSADVYNDLGQYQYTTNVSQFAGWVGGTTVGVGTTGLFWENVANGTYWLGHNGVLYNAMPAEGNYGQAINNNGSDGYADMNFSEQNSDTNKKLVSAAAKGLVQKFGMNEKRAQSVASALNSWAVSAAIRGYTTETDMSKTFQTVFGVEYSTALSAVKDLKNGKKDGMRELTNRSADALGMKPAQAQNYIKSMYSKALSDYGYDINEISW